MTPAECSRTFRSQAVTVWDQMDEGPQQLQVRKALPPFISHWMVGATLQLWILKRLQQAAALLPRRILARCRCLLLQGIGLSDLEEKAQAVSKFRLAASPWIMREISRREPKT